MPKIIIMSRSNAYKYQFKNHNEKTAIISITDVDASYNNIHCTSQNGIKAVLALKFEDVERGYPDCITFADAEKIVDFVNAYKDKVDTIIVHCEAGISRSSGVAAAITKYFGGDDKSIFDSPKYCPNMACYNAVLEAFKQREVTTDER